MEGDGRGQTRTCRAHLGSHERIYTPSARPLAPRIAPRMAWLVGFAIWSFQKILASLEVRRALRLAVQMARCASTSGEASAGAAGVAGTAATGLPAVGAGDDMACVWRCRMSVRVRAKGLAREGEEWC